MELSVKPVHNPAVLSRKIAKDEMVLVNGDNATSLALTNHTAVLIWDLVDGQNSVEDIIAGVSQEFQNVPDNVSNDVLALLELLADDGFIGQEWETLS